MPGQSSPTRNNCSLQLSKSANSKLSQNHVTATHLTSFLSSCKNEILDNEIKYHLPDWTVEDVVIWARSIECLSNDVIGCLQNEKIDGGVLLTLSEEDIRYIFDLRNRSNHQLPYGDLKKLWLAVRSLQEQHKRNTLKDAGFMGADYECANKTVNSLLNDATTQFQQRQQTIEENCCQHAENREAHTIGNYFSTTDYTNNVSNSDAETWAPVMIDGRAVNIPPEFFKTFISLGYSFLVTWITSFVMVIVHERVPDMKRYPPLPDIFLDNVPHIPWAFHMCEITGTLLFAIWSCVCIFHKYRMVLLRRFFALAGTVFLLRCVTMLITSLSVPGTHLQCNPSDYAVDDTDLSLREALELRISRAYTIWSGLGMSIQGVRTCGDYMFSGHTVALTLLNFFITEYTPRNLYFLHTLTWLLNMFGIFFILAAHEHYSIDVFVAFYITSRLFLYYHTLANNQALMSRDSTRTRIWFPMFSYFESSVDGIIPNEFDTLSTLLDGLLRLLLEIKDTCMMTAQRFSVEKPNFALSTRNLLLLPAASKEHRHVATSTHAAAVSSIQSPSSTVPTELAADDSIAITAHIEIASGNASGNVSFAKTCSNHNNNNENSVETQPVRTAPSPPQPAAASSKAKVENKKEI